MHSNTTDTFLNNIECYYIRDIIDKNEKKSAYVTNLENILKKQNLKMGKVTLTADEASSLSTLRTHIAIKMQKRSEIEILAMKFSLWRKSKFEGSWRKNAKSKRKWLSLRAKA